MQLSHCLLSGEKRGDFKSAVLSVQDFRRFNFHAAAIVFFEN